MYAGEIPYLRASRAPQGHPLGVLIPPLGRKIHILGKTYKRYVGEIPYLRCSGAPQENPLGVLKLPLGCKILIFGDRKLKFGMLAVKRLINSKSERFHTFGAPGSPRDIP